MVEQQPSKLNTRVRFPSPAPNPHPGPDCVISKLNLNPRLISLHLGLIFLGALGGLVAKWLGLPLPFILGSMLIVAVATLISENTVRDPEKALLPPGFRFNERFRAIFIGAIGMAIGTRITVDVLETCLLYTSPSPRDRG